MLSKGADHTIEGHGGDVAEHGAQLQTEATVRGDQGIAGHVRPHLAVAQDEVRQDGEDRLAGGALDTPDGETTQTDPSVMGVAGQTPATGAGRFMGELKKPRERRKAKTNSIKALPSPSS